MDKSTDGIPVHRQEFILYSTVVQREEKRREEKWNERTKQTVYALSFCRGFV